MAKSNKEKQTQVRKEVKARGWVWYHRAIPPEWKKHFDDLLRALKKGVK